MEINNFSYLSGTNNVETKKEIIPVSNNNQEENTKNENKKLPLVTAQYALNNHLQIKQPSFGACKNEFDLLVEKYKKDPDCDFAELKAFIEYKRMLDEEFESSSEREKETALKQRFGINFDTFGIFCNKFSISVKCEAKIKDTLLEKFVYVDKLSKPVDIIEAYNDYLKSIADKTNLFNGDDISQLDNNKNVYVCLDENGLPDENKIALIKKLHSMSPDLTKVNDDIFSSSYLSSPAIKIMEKFKDCDINKIVNEILPKLEDKDNKNYTNLTNEIEKLLDSKNPEFDLKVINFVRNVNKTEEENHSQYFNSDINFLLYKIHNEELLDLYSSIYDIGLTLKDTKSLVYSDLEKDDAINLAKALSGVKPDQYGSDRREINNFDDYVCLYEKLCENNDENGKKEFLNKVEILKNKCFTNTAILTLLTADKNKYSEFENKILKNFNKLYTDEPDYRVSIDKELTNKYLKLSERDVNIICDTVSHFTKNIDKLQQHDEDISESELAYGINLSHEIIIEIVNMLNQDVMNSAVELKLLGIATLLRNVENLKNLDNKAKELLKEKLNQLSHPRQKLDTLSTVSSLIGQIDDNILLDIINNIKSPKMTEKQKELANDIFSDKNTDYSLQIEEFITKFNVPDSKRDTIRKFLLKADLQNKYRTPQSFEKQMQIIETKINAIIRNEKIPQNKKDICLKVLNEQKQDLIQNPNKYTKPRIDDNSMKNLASQIEAHINSPNNDKEFNNLIKVQLYKLLDIETNNDLLNNIKYDDKYFSNIFSSLKDGAFKENFVKLIKLIKNNPDKKLSEILDTIENNKKTHRLFDEKGLDYNRWINFDENSKLNFTLEVNVEKSLQAAKNNLMQELNSELVQKLDKNEIFKLIKITNDMNIEKANKKELPKIIKAIEEEIKNNKYWKNNENSDIKTFKDHIKIHKKNIQDLETLKNSKEELSVRLWNKNDIGRNLFFGNHVGCCTSIGSFNSFAAPQHLMNSFVNGIEIVDRNDNSMGNSMCYFADVDGELTFVIDSFEANGKLGASKDVTDAIIDYAKQVCKEMGRADTKIMFGPNYNKLNFEKLHLTPAHTINVIGCADETTYIDALGGHTIINDAKSERAMYEINFT